jgi:CBS domain-containing protein
LIGVVTRYELEQIAESGSHRNFFDAIRREPVIAYPDEPLRVVVTRMFQTGLTRLPVVEKGAQRKLAGVISLADLLKARTLNLEAESRRERILPIRLLFPFRARGINEKKAS